MSDQSACRPAEEASRGAGFRSRLANELLAKIKNRSARVIGAWVRRRDRRWALGLQAPPAGVASRGARAGCPPRRAAIAR